ncbi:MAG: TAXI family TRAP transporter solute-binding subunit [Desulfatiglandaceae bacterium]
MKRLFFIAVLAVLALGLCIVPAETKAKSVFVSIGGGPTGGTFNYFANGISLYVPKTYPEIKMSAEGSGGSAENVRRVHGGDFDFGLSYTVDIALAAKGQLPKDEKIYDKVRCLGFLYGAPAQLVVDADSPFKSAKDLAGKRVAVGNAGSGAALSAERFFRHIGVWDKFQPQFLGYSAAASAFKDGKIDAFWVLVGYPNASVIEAATMSKIKLLDVGKDAEETGFYNEYPYVSTVIPADTYPGQTEDIMTFQDGTILTSRSDVDEDIVYKVVKATWSKEGLEHMVQAHKAAREMSVENNFKGSSRPLHKGAVRFWEEKGISIPDDLKPID